MGNPNQVYYLNFQEKQCMLQKLNLRMAHEVLTSVWTRQDQSQQ